MIRNTSTYLVLVLVVLCVGCHKISPNSGQGKLNAVAAQVELEPPNSTVVDITGEALLPKDSPVADERCRTAAIIDGLRKFASLGSKADTAVNQNPSDTIIAIRDWEGMMIRGVTIRQNGIILMDSVVVAVMQSIDPPRFLHWKTFNFQLVTPPPEQDAELDKLSEALKARGIETAGGRQISPNYWEEKLNVRRLKAEAGKQ
jgi:hypothetical protein